MTDKEFTRRKSEYNNRISERLGDIAKAYVEVYPKGDGYYLRKPDKGMVSAEDYEWCGKIAKEIFNQNSQ